MSDAIWPHHKGGKEIRYHNLCARLTRHGFDVQVFTMHWWSGPRHRDSGGIRYTAVSPCVPLYAGDRRSIAQAVLFSLGCSQLLWHRYDAIEADQMPYLPLFPLRLIATLKRVPLVVAWHEVWGDDYWREYLGRAGAIGAALERAAMRLPDQLVVHNEETRDRLTNNGVSAERISVLPSGVDLTQIAAANPDPAVFDLIYVGRLIEHKRVGDLLGAIGQLSSDGAPLTCAIVGDGPERDRLEQRAAELSISEQIRFFGTVDQHETVYGLIKSSGCFVLPSVREGFGVVVVEAFACGVPVITTDHPDNMARLLVDDGVTGWLSRPTVDGLACALRRSREQSCDLSRAAATLERCDWDRIAGRLAGLYEQLASAA